MRRFGGEQAPGTTGEGGPRHPAAIQEKNLASARDSLIQAFQALKRANEPSLVASLASMIQQVLDRHSRADLNDIFACIVDHRRGRTLIHLALSNHYEQPAAQRAVTLLIKECCNQGLVAADVRGWTALHYASFHKAPLAAIQHILEVCPESARATSRVKSTPLHLACWHGASWQVMELLVQTYPEALQCRNREGNTPLHLVMRSLNPWSDKTVRFLAEQSPETLSMLNYRESTPLHMAVTNRNLNHETLQLLMHLNPNAVRTVGRDSGSTVLHEACRRKNVPMEWIQELVKAWPIVCLILDEVKWLPLDMAEQRQRRHVRRATITEIVEQSTRQAVRALLEVALIMKRKYPISVPCLAFPTPLDPILEAFVSELPEFQEAIANHSQDNCGGGLFALVQQISERLERKHFFSLLKDERVQSLLRSSTHHQALLVGLLQMEEAGRSYLVHNECDRGAGVRVLSAVSDNLDCLFIHLRENPTLIR